MQKSIQQKNKKTNNTNKIVTKHNKFIEQIEDIAKECEFDPSSIISSFQCHKISSSHFFLYKKYQNKRAFVVEFCQKECKIATPKANLIKLWKALNKKYNLLLNRPCHPTTINPSIWNTKSLVYIPPHCTKHIIDIQLVQEPFVNAKGLYQYLNWTIRVNKINKFIKIFKTSNGIDILVINSELHDKYGNILYMLCIQNDIISTKSQQWQFVKLVTEQEILELFTERLSLITGYINNIHSSVSKVGSVSNVIRLIAQYTDCSVTLPSGARSKADQFEPVRANKLLSKECIRNQRLPQNKYRQLKSVRTGYDKENRNNKDILHVSTNQFYQCINNALNSNDPKHKLVPIVSILTGKKYPHGQYNVDQVLPVKIEGNWIGIVYREGLPVMTLIDGYDIKNKAVLCNPSFDKSKLEHFKNNITKIEISNSFRRASVPNKKRQHPQQYKQFDNTINTQDDTQYDTQFGDKYGYGQFVDKSLDDKLDDKLDNMYTEGDISTTSTNNVDTVQDGVADTSMNNHCNNTTNFSVAVATDGYQQYPTTTTTIPSSYIGSYSFRPYGNTQQQQALYSTTATTTATNLILPHYSLEGINNIIQFAQQQAQYFGQFSNGQFANNLNVTNNVLIPPYIPQSQQSLNMQ